MRLIEDYNARVAGDHDAGYEYDPRNEGDAINSGEWHFGNPDARALSLFEMLSC